MYLILHAPFSVIKLKYLFRSITAKKLNNQERHTEKIRFTF